MASRPMPPNTNPAFIADHQGAIVYPAHPSNIYYPAGRDGAHRGQPNVPRAFVLHTPEVNADDWESTPVWFAGPNRQASTHYYLDDDGDRFQLVPEYCGAIANGLNGKPLPGWALPGISLNWQTISVEIEGRAASIQDSLVVGGRQWAGLLALIVDVCGRHAIPIVRDRLPGHYQLSVDRSDPGPGFPWDALMRDLDRIAKGVTEVFNIWSWGFLDVGTSDPEGPALGEVWVNLNDPSLNPPAAAIGPDLQLEFIIMGAGFVDVYHGADLPGNNRAGQVRDVQSIRVRPSADGRIAVRGGNGATGVRIIPQGYYT